MTLPEPLSAWADAITAAATSACSCCSCSRASCVQLIQPGRVSAWRAGCRSTLASAWSTTCATGCSNTCESLGLHHHITTSTGDAVYRVDVDSYAIENLVDERRIPAGHLGHHAGRDVHDPAEPRPVGGAALAVGHAVPVHRAALLRIDAVVARGARQGAGIGADLSGSTRSFSRSALVKSFAREPHRSRSATPRPANSTMRGAHRGDVAAGAVRR